jgi:hypothetical protein
LFGFGGGHDVSRAVEREALRGAELGMRGWSGAQEKKGDEQLTVAHSVSESG